MADVVIPDGLQCFDREEVTVDATAGGVTLTASKILPAGGTQARAALISVQAQPVRMTMQGTAPETSVGLSLAAGSTMLVHGADNLKAIKMIRETGTSSEVEVLYLR